MPAVIEPPGEFM